MKKNKLTTAVIAGLAGITGVASVGNAVYVNPEGTGQVLIYPYYSVNNGLDTTYSIVNTANETKAVKVRFLESAHSREVLDFNIYMSPYDVWVGALVAKTSTYSGHSGEPSGMHIRADNTCAPFVRAQEEFRPFEIEKDTAPGLIYDNMQRGRVGHVEVLEMGVVNPASYFATAAKHDSSGVPADCSAFEAAWKTTLNGGTEIWASPGGNPGVDILPPTGGLFGAASIIDVGNGFNVSYDATALGNWRNAHFHTNPGSLEPGINAAQPRESTVMYKNLAGNVVLQTDAWLTGAEAVSATLMREDIYNEYTHEASVEGKSSWVVNFPTKFYHVEPTPAVQPFTNSWLPNYPTGDFRACEEYDISVWDREERFYVRDDTGISPPGGSTGDTPNFCWETNNLEFISETGTPGQADILGGNYLQTYTSKINGTPNGWARISFANSMTSLDLNSFIGLPVAGFMAQQLVNNNADPGVMAQYGGLFNHKGKISSGN
jgi:hypothetical protein